MQLRSQIYTVRAIIVSERNLAHADMLKSILQYELSSLTEIDIYTDPGIDTDVFQSTGYDIYISDYPTHNEYDNHIYIENIPRIADIRKLQDMIAKIVAGRKENYEHNINSRVYPSNRPE